MLQLARRTESLRRQIAETAEIMAPQPQRVTDPFEQATQRAHQAFAEATRARMAEAAARAPRPFGSGFAARSEPVTCPECIACDATPEESWLIHNDPQPMPLPDDWAPLDVEAGRGEVNVYQVPPEGWEAVRAHDAVDGIAAAALRARSWVSGERGPGRGCAPGAGAGRDGSWPVRGRLGRAGRLRADGAREQS